MFTSKLNKFDVLGILLVIFLFILLGLSLGIQTSNLWKINLQIKTLFNDILFSFLRVSITAVIAWIFGICTGYILYHYQLLNRIFLPSVNFIRHISPFAWLPFAIFWFGLGEAPVAFIMFITLFFPTLIAASDNFANIPHEYIDEARVSGASQFQLWKYIELPLTLINHLNLFRIIWGLGWSVIIAAEMLGVNKGLGFRLLDFRYLLKYKEMVIYLVVMGFMGIFVDYILRRIIFCFKIKMFGK